MKIAARRRSFWVLILVEALILFVGAVSANKGFLNFSIWNRSLISRNQVFGLPNSYETIFHLDFSQGITNFGTITAWTDALISRGNSRLSQGKVSWTGFKSGAFTFNAKFGDDLFQNSNLESRFINLFHPYLYFRGGTGGLTSKAFDLALFGGNMAHLVGLLGSTYEVKDQRFYGFKARLKLGDAWILGTSLFRAENGGDAAGGLEAKKNDLILFDSEFMVVPGVRILGEFRRSMAEEPSSRTTSGNSYRFGPLIKAGRWDFEANYRFTGNRFRDLTPESQIFRDEKGIFSSLRLQVSRSLTLFGIADRSNDNVERDPSRNVNNALSITSGFNLYSPSFLDLTAQWEYDQRESEKRLSDFVDYLSNGVFIQASKTLGSFFPYLRFRWQRSEDKAYPERNTTRPTLYLGFRQGLTRGAFIWLEGELNRRLNASNREIDRNVNIRTGLNYALSSRLDLYTELFYRRYGVRNISEYIEAFLGLRINLFRDTTLRIDVRALEPLNGKELPSSYLFTLHFNKRFSWGAPPRVIGRYALGDRSIGVGTVDGYVFEDYNGNGLVDLEDKGLAGIPLRLEDGSTVVTDARGRYRFSNVAEGPHRVRIEERNIPASLYILTPVQVNVLVERRATRQILFPMISGATVSGRFIEDTNRSGKIDTDDKGIADILIVLTPIKKKDEEGTPKQMQDLILNTYTNAEGAFVFDNIFPGEYELSVDEETLPQGATISVPMPAKIKLEPGQQIEGMDFTVNPRPVIIRKFK